jgi:hypothetical protein
MSNPVLTDLSGRKLPPMGARDAAGVQRVLAVPPVRDMPNEASQELLMTGYSNLAAAGAAFVQLTDPITAAAFADQISAQYMARIDSILFYCPDMVAAVAPYLSAAVRINGQPASAWGNVPLYPRAGVLSLSFETYMVLAPQQTVTLWAMNTDPANTHFFAMYLRGWTWPKDTPEG